MKTNYQRPVSWFDKRVRSFQRRLLREVAYRNGSNQCAMARDMGVHRNTLARMLRDLGLDLPVFKPNPAKNYRPLHLPPKKKTQMREVCTIKIRPWNRRAEF